MRINGLNIGKIFEPKNDNIKAGHVKANGSTAKSDEVSISSRAVEVSRAQQFASSLPEVREDKVSKYQDMIRNNQYKISDDELASAIFGSIMQENNGG